jgi:hypothetical protein
MEKSKKPIFLESEFRNLLFCKAYENSGRSLSSLGSQIGYIARGRNGLIRDMWLGTLGIPSIRINGISKLARLNPNEVLSHQISRDKNLEIKSWMEAFDKYKKTHQKKGKK